MQLSLEVMVSVKLLICSKSVTPKSHRFFKFNPMHEP